MAIQVRLDLTPQEFDLARRALDTYTEVLTARADEISVPPPQRREAKTDLVLTRDLLSKLR